MKLTPSLWKQHIGKLIKRHWWIQRERKVLNMGVDSYLSSLGIQVKDPLQVESPPLPKFEYEREHLNPLKALELKSLSIEKIPCLAFNDNNLLQEGTDQAQLLTKTIIITDKFPEEITNLITSSPPGVNRLVQNIIYTSTIFDAHQEKLPKQKDPARPAWNFPRSYGITSIRKTRDLCKKLLQLCESLNGKYSRNRTVVNDGITSVFLEKESDLLRLALKMDLLLLSSKPLKPIKLYHSDEEFEFPNIYPMHHTISLNKSKVEEVEDQYPIHSESPWNNIHTLFVHTDPTTVQHLTGLPVNENQIHARTLMKSFTAAAMCARQKYGMDVKDLSEPIVVQCVETNGQRFHFSVFQLNTLNLDGTEGVKNYWWSSPNMQLYEVAEYQRAQPVLEGYNPQVFDTICAFYKNN